MYVCMYACMYVCMDGCMYVCPQCCSQLIALQACSFCTPVFQIVSETHSNITSNTDKIQGKHVHNHFLALSFTTSSPFPLSFPLFLHIPFLNFAFHLNSVSEGNWEHVGLSGPIIRSSEGDVRGWVFDAFWDLKYMVFLLHKSSPEKVSLPQLLCRVLPALSNRLRVQTHFL